MAKPWNRWYHGMGGTYGFWLPGDARGFRTRHHREHVEGDYRNPPPPGLYEERFKHSKALQRFEAVTFSHEERVIVCRVMGQTLLEYDVELVDLAVGGNHFHLLCRFPLQSVAFREKQTPQNLLKDGRDPMGRHLLGRAKRAASVELLRLRCRQQGRPLWARRTKLEPIKSREHQLAVVKYIRKHAQQGAALWSELLKKSEA